MPLDAYSGPDDIGVAAKKAMRRSFVIGLVIGICVGVLAVIAVGLLILQRGAA